jgi:hypothetical protein
MSKSKKVVITFGILFLAAFLLSYFVVDFPFAAAGLNREVARAKVNKIPMVREDLNPNPPVKPDENAAPLMVQIARNALGDFNHVREKISPDARDADEIRELDNLKAAEKHLPAFLEANKKPSYWVDRDYDESVNLLFPEFSGFKDFSKALATRARLRAEKGDLQGSIDDLNAGLQISRHLSEEPTLIGQLVSIAIYSIESNAVAKVASNFSNDAKSLERLRREVVEKSTPPDDFDKALRGEVYMEIALLRNMQRYRGYRGIQDLADGREPKPRPDIPLQRSGMPKGIVARAFMARCLGYWNHVMESTAWKERDWANLGPDMDKYALQHDISKTHHLSDSFNSIFMPVFGAAGRSYAGAEAYKRVTRSLLLVMEYSAKNHRFPTDLKQAGAEADDPYLHGVKLRYQSDGKSAKVWSVGKDGKDDGGEKKKAKDIVAMYPSR